MSIHYANQRFLILGAGVTGSAVAKALKNRGGLVTIADDNANDAVKPESIDLSDFDAVVISPGWRQDHRRHPPALRAGRRPAAQRG